MPIICMYPHHTASASRGRLGRWCVALAEAAAGTGLDPANLGEVGQSCGRVGARRRWRPFPSICARYPATPNAPMDANCTARTVLLFSRNESRHILRRQTDHLSRGQQQGANFQFLARCSAPTRHRYLCLCLCFQQGWAAGRLMEEAENRVIKTHGRVTAPR